MRIITLDELNNEIFFFSDRIKNGAVFIYPTDTIYGIGCSALNPQSVQKVRALKGRWNKPFSVIAPSKDWILENCEVSKAKKEWLDKLPGAYTLVLKLKKSCVAKEANLGLGTLGIRIPKHWISDFVSKLNMPIVTTSVNKTGAEYAELLDDIDNEIKNGVEFAINEGYKNGNPSKIVDLTEDVKIIER